MKAKLGTLCIALGLVLVALAAGLYGYNRWDASRAAQASDKVLDVLEQEPPAKDCPLIGLDNCIITPHIAWSPKEMRQAVIDILAENLESWLTGGMKNRVD